MRNPSEPEIIWRAKGSSRGFLRIGAIVAVPENIYGLGADTLEILIDSEYLDTEFINFGRTNMYLNRHLYVDNILGIYFYTAPNTAPLPGVVDIDFVYLGDTGVVNDPVTKKIHFGAFYDSNENGVRETGEKLLNQGEFVSIGSDNEYKNAVLLTSDSNFSAMALDTGLQTVVYNSIYNGFSLTTDSVFQIDVQLSSSDTILVGLKTNNSFLPTLNASGNFNGVPRCFGEGEYLVDVTNFDGSSHDVVYKICFNDLLYDFNVYLENADSVYDKCFYYSMKQMGAFENRRISHRISLPGVDAIGEEFNLNLSANYTDPTLAINATDSTVRIVVCAYDPNDKHVNIKKLSPLYQNEYLDYKIRFQNTGNDTAFSVIIRDTLSDHLDWSTFELISSSDDVEIHFQQNKYEFAFINILLPDSNVNEPNSHGYIRYKVRAINGLTVGEKIENTGHIYFDFNPAIVTNTIVTEIKTPNSIQKQLKKGTLKIIPNPTYDYVTVEGKIGLIQIFDSNGRLVLTTNESRISVSKLNPGFYIVKSNDTYARLIVL